MAKLPYFPFDARDYLLDTKIRGLNKTERGIVIDLWCWMWVNSVRRGHLLERVNGKVRALTDEEIASMLQLELGEWQVTRQKLVEKVGILKIGKLEELYSGRLSKYKTNHQLYGSRSETNRKPIETLSIPNLIQYKGSEIEIELNIREVDVKRLEALYPDKDIKALIIEADNYNRDLPPDKKKTRHRQFVNWWIKNSDKFKGDKYARPSTSKRYNPSDSSKFGKGGFQEIPKL